MHYQSVKIKNYKSIRELTLPLTTFNVFIGANGCGKSNILEAIAMYAAAATNGSFSASISNLQERGVRVARPSLMRNSFLGHKEGSKIEIGLLSKANTEFLTFTLEAKSEDIYSDWEDPEKQKQRKQLQFEEPAKAAATILLHFFRSTRYNFTIYQLTTPALRGLSNDSKLQPLGIYGEGLDVLINNFDKEERAQFDEYLYLIDWLEDVEIDEGDRHKNQGHKLGRSSSRLYFRDKYMRRNNNLFSSENSNEGVLHILFYLALFISKRTPKFFAIDGIETSLNPRICRELTRVLAELAVKNQKQALITTHNPAVLDGINLNDEQQALFVVSRNDEGHTRTQQIKERPTLSESDKNYKLSELWLRNKIPNSTPDNF